MGRGAAWIKGGEMKGREGEGECECQCECQCQCQCQWSGVEWSGVDEVEWTRWSAARWKVDGVWGGQGPLVSPPLFLSLSQQTRCWNGGLRVTAYPIHPCARPFARSAHFLGFGARDVRRSGAPRERTRQWHRAQVSAGFSTGPASRMRPGADPSLPLGRGVSGSLVESRVESGLAWEGEANGCGGEAKGWMDACCGVCT